jgi:hypothetical protein
MPELLLPSSAPAMRYANLSAAACRTELSRRKLPFKRDRRPTPGVATGTRFTGPVDGVTFLSAGWRSPYGVFDCRLALAFAELTGVLKEHQVVQVVIGTIYRRGSKLRRGKPSQHAHGLAADVVAFKLEDGTELSVEHDYQGQLGEPSCGPGSTVGAATPKAILLRNLTCDIARGGFFHYMLTPNHYQAHHDHLHLDIKRNAKRGVIR